jgi:hypothetical protein
VGAHRAAAGCSGKRDRAAFVPLPAFDDKTLLSDLRLLEETARAAERAKRSRGGGEDDARGGGGSELPRNALQLQRVRRRETLCAAAAGRVRARVCVMTRLCRLARRWRASAARSCCSRRRAWRGGRATPAACNRRQRRAAS